MARACPRVRRSPPPPLYVPGSGTALGRWREVCSAAPLVYARRVDLAAPLPPRPVDLVARLGVAAEDVIAAWTQGPLAARMRREPPGPHRRGALGAACQDLGRALGDALESGAMGPLALWVRREAPGHLSARDLSALVRGFFELPRRAACELGDASLADAVGAVAAEALSVVVEAAVARARDERGPRPAEDLDDVAAVLTDTLLSMHPDGGVHYVSAGITETTGLRAEEVRANPSALEEVES